VPPEKCNYLAKNPKFGRLEVGSQEALQIASQYKMGVLNDKEHI
jgi:hypothetical protein